jgi:hypothetical protein
MAYQKPTQDEPSGGGSAISGVLTGESVMTALSEKPTTIFKLRKRLGTSAEQELLVLLLQLRLAGAVKFDITSGCWSVR